MSNPSGSKFNKIFLISVMGLASGLVGCGGSSSGNDPVTESSPTNVSIGGTAAKGIIKNGIVTAEELNTSGEVIASIGSAVTGADGTYSLTLNNNYSGGPIQVSISNGTDTEMKCDVPGGCGTRTDAITDANNAGVIDFGEWYQPAALSMTALVPDAQSNETIGVSITPFTNMAAARALASGTLDATTIAEANSEVSNLLGGIDILNTAPVDITDPAATDAASPTETTYAALASALSNQDDVPVDENGQPDLNAAIELLADSFSSGTIAADDTDGDDAAQISLQEIISSAEQTFTQAGIADTTGVIEDLQQDITTAEAGDGTIDPEPSETVADANLNKVKAMVTDVRTWGTVIDAEIGTKGTEFETEIDLASGALNSLAVNQGPADVLGHAIEAVSLYFDGNTSGDLTTYATDSNDLGEPIYLFTGGTITKSVEGVYTITDGLINGYTVNMSINFLPDDGASINTLTLGIQSATIISNDTNLTINNGTVTIALAEPYTIDYNAIDLGVEQPLPLVTDATFDLDVSLTQYNGADEFGTPVTLASPVTFAGTLAFDLEPVTIKGSTDVNQSALPKTFELSGTVSNTGNSMDMSLVMNVINTDTFQFEGDFAPVGTLYSANHTEPFVEWNYTDADATAGVDTFTYIDPYYSYTAYWNSTDGSVTETYNYSDGYSVPGYTWGSFDSLSTYLSSVIPYYPTYQSFYIDNEGRYSVDLSAADFTQDGSSDGQLIDPEFIIESADNWIDVNIGLTFVAQLTGLPEARINITGDRTAFEAGDAEVTISYGSRQLALTGSVTNDQVDGVLAITNQDNVVMNLVFSDDDLTPFSGSLKYNAVQYATVTETASGYLKITYTDGTFEIF